jgi:hypothetical protein
MNAHIQCMLHNKYFLKHNLFNKLHTRLKYKISLCFHHISITHEKFFIYITQSVSLNILLSMLPVKEIKQKYKHAPSTT